MEPKNPKGPKGPNPLATLWRFFSPYKKWVFLLCIISTAGSSLGLLIPRTLGMLLDQFAQNPETSASVLPAIGLAMGAFIMTMCGIVLSAWLSERVAYDIRTQLIMKMGEQSFPYIIGQTPGRLLTILTSDVDNIKNIAAQGLVTLLGASITLIGSVILLFSLNVQLAAVTVATIPFLLATFFGVFRKLGPLFAKTQHNLETVNRVINESIIAASLVRVLNTHASEERKFDTVNTATRSVGVSIVKGISALIPLVTLFANLAIMVIVWFGGNAIMQGTASVGTISAFVSYANMFVWPIFVLGFIGTSLTRAFVSMGRVVTILDAPIAETQGTIKKTIAGALQVQNISLDYSGRTVIRDASFSIKPHTRVAIIGPTGAGKTQLLYLISGLISPTSGSITLDGAPLESYEKQALFAQMGIVFQDSSLFGSTIRENIQYDDSISDAALQKAISVAQLQEFVASLPEGMDTSVSERGMNLSGGQKQRLCLARALARNPKLLILDDVTARLDMATERAMMDALAKEYSDLSLVVVSQKIESVKDFDHIILLMEGDILAQGKHSELLEASWEYKHLFESQKTHA